MAFSPGWCYQPGLKGPGLYISNGSCSVHLLLFDLHIDHRRRHRHLRSRLRRPAPPGRRARLCRAVIVVYPRPAAPSARPASRAVSPPHPVSAAAPEPTLRRRPLPARPRRRAPPGGRRAHLPHRAIVVPHPAAPIRPHRSRRLLRTSSSREVFSSAPWPASTPCPARHPPS